MSEQIEVNLSSSALSHAGCIRNLHLTVVDGYKEKAMPARMVYGVGVHKFIEVMYKTGGRIDLARQAAIECVTNIPRIDDRKSMHLSDVMHMTTVALYTWEMKVKKETDFKVLDLNGAPAVELTFSIPFYQDEVARYNWCGTIDRLGKIDNGCYCIKDWKNTSTWSPREYFTQYELSRQPRGYVLALKMMAELYPDSLLGQIGKGKVGAQFNAVFVKPAANDVTFGDSDVFQYDDAHIAEFRMGIEDECKKLSSAIKTGYLPKQGIVNGSCEGKWGKCAFWVPCQHPEPVAQILLKRDFDQKPFSPLNYNDK